jgi:uncharacterized protein
MTSFTPVAALIGGALIGLSAMLLMLLTGRIAGISGILGGCLTFSGTDQGWRLAFLGGLAASPLLAAIAGAPIVDPVMPSSWAVIIVAGLLVGVGTRIGGGCTSGHGICGIARLSPRSVVATIVFVAVAMIVVFVTRHLVGA